MIKLLTCSIIAFLSFSSCCKAQNRRAIDSLEFVLKSADNAATVDILFSLGCEFSNVDDSRALGYGNDALCLSKILGDSIQYVRVGRLVATTLQNLDRLEEAKQILLQILAIAKRNGFRKEYKYILNSLGMTYYSFARYDVALKYFLESYSLRETDGSKNGAKYCLE